jgi:hypothetical protein
MKMVCFGLLFMVCRGVEAPPPARVTVAVCPVEANWSHAYQRSLASELRALPEGSALASAVQEAVSLRDQARACRARTR